MRGEQVIDCTHSLYEYGKKTQNCLLPTLFTIYIDQLSVVRAQPDHPCTIPHRTFSLARKTVPWANAVGHPLTSWYDNRSSPLLPALQQQ